MRAPCSSLCARRSQTTSRSGICATGQGQDHRGAAAGAAPRVGKTKAGRFALPLSTRRAPAEGWDFVDPQRGVDYAYVTNRTGAKVSGAPSEVAVRDTVAAVVGV